MVKMCIKFPQAVIEQLNQIEFPFDDINDFTGAKSKSIIILSDYAGEKDGFETFAYYITDWNTCGILVNELRKVKIRNGIPERTIQYKGRKDKKKINAFEEWMQVVKSYPGIILVFGYDNRMKSEKIYREDIKNAKGGIIEFGLYDNVKIAQKMWKALSFAVIFPKIFKDKHNVIWVSDDDDIFGNKVRTDAVFDTLNDMCLRIGSPKFDTFGIGTPFDNKEEFKIFEEMLSIADMAVGAFAASLKYGDEQIICPDEETDRIIEEFSVVPHVTQFVKKQNLYPLFACSLLKVAYTDEGEPYFRLFEQKIDRVLRFITLDEFRKWLLKHHRIALDVWVEFAKSQEEGLLTLEQAEIECARYGWIKKEERNLNVQVVGYKFESKT